MKKIKILSVVLSVFLLLSAITGCNGKSGGETSKPETDTPGSSTGGKNAGGVFFRPGDGGAGDATPIYHDGKYYLFFLHSVSKKWCYSTTTDFVDYSDITVLRDFGGTGCVLNVDGTWHLFAAKRSGKEEIIHHYTGTDIDALQNTNKSISSDGKQFSEQEWRDPFIWYDDSLGEYVMIVATLAKDKTAVDRNGCVAYLTSKDLYKWDLKGTFFAPEFYQGVCECPDYFKIGDWYYLVYSDCTFGKRTYYAKSKDPYGPWEIPDNDTLDSLFFYAARTASDGQDRYAFGWAGDRSGHVLPLNEDGTMKDPDFATIQYAGNMVVHKLEQKPNGDLTAAPVDSIVNSFTKSVKNKFTPLTENWEKDGDYAKTSAENGMSAMLMQKLPESFVLTFKLKTDAKQAGIALNVDSSFSNRGYLFAFDRQFSRLRQISGALSGIGGYYFPYESEIEKSITFDPEKTYEVTVIRSGQVATIYVDGECALTTRMTSTNELALGLFCYAGTAEFTEITMKKPE